MPTSDKNQDKHKTLLHILMHIGKLLDERIAKKLAKLGLHHGQGRVLINLLRHGSMNQANLTRAMNRKPATITIMLRPLEERNLIERTPDPKTNRAMVVSLTAEGKRVAKQVQKAWRQIESGLSAAIPCGQQKRLFEQLESLRSVLGGSTPEFISYQSREQRHA